jgi:hypothetical protein
MKKDRLMTRTINRMMRVIMVLKVKTMRLTTIAMKKDRLMTRTVNRMMRVIMMLR